ncbi:MAG: FIST C-terminal domain-containing protein [Fluviicola sp.]|nr:FIST C-terminal domain-containing protein [Fluviicola sp.]MBP6271819.1 FIST C-terminal domain-containing protein [Fluviicola sp.]
MLQFFSASTRVVNTKRGVMECLESALGTKYKEADLLIFHASIGHDFQELVDQAKELVPTATVLAASCCGVVGKEGVSESMKDIALMAVTGKEFAMTHVPEISGKTAFEKAQQMALNLKAQSEKINMIYFLGSGIDTDNQQVIDAFELVFGPDVTLFGATSSDNMKGFINYQAINGTVYEHAAYAVGFFDETITVDTQATHGFNAIGEPMIVTKANGHIIHEINHKPAWEEYLHHLGLPENATCGESIPIGAIAEELTPDQANEYGNKHILRVVTKHDGSAIYYPVSCVEGTKIWLCKRDEELIFSEMEKMVNKMTERAQGKKPIAVFHADCLARGRFLFNRVIKEELVSKMQYPFYENGVCPPWLGMYGFGEFARLNGKNTYHNYTTALYTLYRK